MPWTYSGDPSNSDLDKYRFAIGDTVESDPVMQDEEIQYIIDGSINDTRILFELYDRAANIFARAPKRSLGPQSEDYTSRLEYFQNKAKYYRTLYASTSGLSIPKSTDIIFRKGMHDNV